MTITALTAAILEIAAGSQCIFDADLIDNALAAGGTSLHWDEDEACWLIRKLNGDAVAAVYTDGVYINGNPL